MSELQQIVSKVKPNGTHINTENYWAPLADEDNDNVCNKAAPAQQATINNVSNAEGKALTMVIDSGATQYIRIKIDDIPDEIIVEYNLRNKVSNNGHVCIEIQKGMYGLPQAGILAQELLEKQLNEHGYSQSKAVPTL
jgi:hypothetical protein